jgi:ketosteroid isomerase-like protein
MTKNFLPFLLGICFAFVSCTESANKFEPLSQEDMNAISELRNNVVSAIKAGDAKAYGQLCSDSVRLMHPNFPIVNGRAELVEHNATMFAAVKVTTLIVTPVDIYGIGDLAYEVGTQSVQIDPPMEGFSSTRKYLHVMRKSDDGKWHFVALMSSDN